MTDPFLDDGCTGFLNGWGGLSWRACCDAHDIAFATGSNWGDFIAANAELYRCVARHDIFAATLMLIAVMTIGIAFFWLGPKRPAATKRTTE